MLNVQFNEGVDDILMLILPSGIRSFPVVLSFSLVWLFLVTIRPANHTYSQGFDEFMNVVLDEAAEVYVKDAKPRRDLGT